MIVIVQHLFGYDSDADPEYIPSDENGRSEDKEQIMNQTDEQQRRQDSTNDSVLTWGSVDKDNLFVFQFNPTPSISVEIIDQVVDKSPLEVYQLFVDELFSFIAEQTNIKQSKLLKILNHLII